MQRFAPVRTAAAIALAGFLSSGAASAAILHTAALRLGDDADFSYLFTNHGNRRAVACVSTATDGCLATAPAY